MQQLLLETDNLTHVGQGSRARRGRNGSVGFKLSTTFFKHLPGLNLPVSNSAVCTVASGEHEIRICCHSCFCISYHSYCGAEMGFLLLYILYVVAVRQVLLHSWEVISWLKLMTWCVCVCMGGYVRACTRLHAYHFIVYCFITEQNMFRVNVICLQITLLCIMFGTVETWGMQWRSWLRHCATSWRVVGFIPDGISGIFYWHNFSCHTVALGSIQPLTEMRTRNTSWGVKAASV